MSIFAETVAKAVGDYRYLLRRYLPQSERMHKLEELHLKDPSLYESDINLYNVAWSIIRDIEKNMEIPEQGYYSYSGIQHFCDYLKEYLENYICENDEIIHKAQKASRSLINVIQLVMMPENRLSDSIADKIKKHSEVIAFYGSDEQLEIYRSTLERQVEQNPIFFESILKHFDDQVAAASSVDDIVEEAA